jgi:hypothetical protein
MIAPPFALSARGGMPRFIDAAPAQLWTAHAPQPPTIAIISFSKLFTCEYAD